MKKFLIVVMFGYSFNLLPVSVQMPSQEILIQRLSELGHTDLIRETEIVSQLANKNFNMTELEEIVTLACLAYVQRFEQLMFEQDYRAMQTVVLKDKPLIVNALRQSHMQP